MRKLKNSELNRIDISTFKSIKKTPLIVVLDDIRSLNNVGSIFRTCDAFKIEKLYLCGITATPPNRKITKTSIGATESVEWVYNDNINDLISELKNQGFKVWAIEQTENSKTLSEMEMIEINRKHVLIFGNELNGVKTLTSATPDVAIAFITSSSINVPFVSFFPEPVVTILF